MQRINRRRRRPFTHRNPLSPNLRRRLQSQEPAPVNESRVPPTATVTAIEEGEVKEPGEQVEPDATHAPEHNPVEDSAIEAPAPLDEQDPIPDEVSPPSEEEIKEPEYPWTLKQFPKLQNPWENLQRSRAVESEVPPLVVVAPITKEEIDESKHEVEAAHSPETVVKELAPAVESHTSPLVAATIIEEEEIRGPEPQLEIEATSAAEPIVAGSPEETTAEGSAAALLQETLDTPKDDEIREEDSGT